MLYVRTKTAELINIYKERDNLFLLLPVFNYYCVLCKGFPLSNLFLSLMYISIN